MYLKTLKIKDIIPYERNPRINDQAVPAVMESTQRDGYRNPGQNAVLVNE